MDAMRTEKTRGSDTKPWKSHDEDKSDEPMIQKVLTDKDARSYKNQSPSRSPLRFDKNFVLFIAATDIMNIWRNRASARRVGRAVSIFAMFSVEPLASQRSGSRVSKG